MARTILATQRLNVQAGVAVAFTEPDVPNQMQYRNTGVEVVAVRVGSGAAITITIPSVVDPFGRLGDRVVSITAAQGERFFALGPYTPPQIWGDGASQGHINPSGVSGSTGIAVIAA